MTRVGNGNNGGGLSALGSIRLDLLDELLSGNNLSEDNVLSVQPGGGDGGDEELGSVGVGSSVGHGKEERLAVSVLEVLISELLSVDALTSGSVTLGEVTTLQHELGDHSVERAGLEVEGLSGLADSLLTSAESTEVLSGLGDILGVELKDDSASGGIVNGDIKEYLRVGHGDAVI